MTNILVKKRRKAHTGREEEKVLGSWRQTEVMQPHTKEHPEPPETGIDKKRSPTLWRECGATYILMSDTWPLEL
jgi:hypothetical protein